MRAPFLPLGDLLSALGRDLVRIQERLDDAAGPTRNDTGQAAARDGDVGDRLVAGTTEVTLRLATSVAHEHGAALMVHPLNLAYVTRFVAQRSEIFTLAVTLQPTPLPAAAAERANPGRNP